MIVNVIDKLPLFEVMEGVVEGGISTRSDFVLISVVGIIDYYVIHCDGKKGYIVESASFYVNNFSENILSKLIETFKLY